MGSDTQGGWVFVVDVTSCERRKIYLFWEISTAPMVFRDIFVFQINGNNAVTLKTDSASH